MKRRDFIKAFGGVSAALASATTLANMKGSEKVIEVFQMNDINNKARLAFVRETEFATMPNGYLKASTNNFDDKAIINIQNPNYESTILVLAYDMKQFNYFRNKIKNSNSFNIKTLNRIHYISEGNRLLGIKRGTKIIGLVDYWKHYNIDSIMDVTYYRNLKILSPNEYFSSREMK